MREMQFETIRDKFWIQDFKPGQEQAISSVLDWKDTLVKMPTSGGKSLCFQWPAMVARNKVSIITSPLIALMWDQLRALEEIWVPATTIDSSIDAKERANRMASLRMWKYKMLYVSPEMLLTKWFQNEVWRTPFDKMVVDEAQCVSTWWNWFRPDYLRLWIAAQRLMIEQKIALWATIDADVEADIIKYLRMDRDNMNIISVPPYRDNLDFSVIKVEWKNIKQADMAKRRQLKTLLEQRDENGATIVYCRTKPEVAEVYQFLLRQKFQNVYMYHGAAGSCDKEFAVENFQSRHAPIMIATSAFGMWVDKSDVRLVIQFWKPYSLQDFNQAWGRAGRDWEDARVIALYRKWDYRQKNDFQGRDIIPNLQYVERVYLQLKAMLADKPSADLSVYTRKRAQLIERDDSIEDYMKPKYIEMLQTALLILRRAGVLIDTRDWFSLTGLPQGGKAHAKIIEHTEMIKEAEQRNTKQLHDYFNSETPDQKRLLELAWLNKYPPA